MIYTIIIIILILFFIFLVFKRNNIDYEKFMNYIPVIKTYKCFSKNIEVIDFINDMNKIFDKYKIENGEIELSTKFTEDLINPNRIVAFIPYDNILKNSELKEKCYEINDIPDEVKENLDKTIKDINFSKAQLLFGIDVDEGSRRVYFNYIDKNKIHLIAYNIEEKIIAKKFYKQLKKHDFKRKMNDLIGSELYNKLLNIFPESMWKLVGVKEDSRIEEYKYSSFYINLNFEYKLEQFSDTLLSFIKSIYKGDEKNIMKWYECYKNNNITWLSIGKNTEGQIQFTIYLVYNRNIRDYIDTKKLTKLNEQMKLLGNILKSKTSFDN